MMGEGRPRRDRDGSRSIRPSDAWREARALIWDRRGRLGIGLLLMLVSRGSGFILPWMSKYVVDEVILGERLDLLPLIAFAAGAGVVIQAISSFALSQILGVAAQRSITEMRKKVQRKILHLPARYFESHKSGALISRIMSDAEGIRNLVGNGLVQLVGGIVSALIGITVLFFLNWKLTLITLTAMALFGGLMAFAFRRIRPIFRERGELNAQVTGRLAESLGGIRVVKAYTAEKREELVFARGVHRLLRNVAKTITASSGVSAIATILFGTAAVIMMIMGARSILAGEMTLGEFTMYVLFTGLVARPVVLIAQIGTQITEAFAGLDRIREVMQQTSEDEDEASLQSLDRVVGDIEFRDVSFAYEPGRPVLKNVSFRAAAGSTTALVGSSGSGKSTLTSLVMTFNRPQQGTILADGRDLSFIRKRDYRSHLGVVLQENFLFDGTILENIRYGSPTATEEEVRNVARIAHVDEFVNPLEKGYDTVIGERGIKLSGGQRQRIAIARAILADPAILILDEATSSLDSESEARIRDGLSSLRRGRTTFVIAHRLSTIRSADQILVLEHGEIVERGNHHELLEHHGRYRQLYERQVRFEEDRFINPGEELAAEAEPEEEGEAVGSEIPGGTETL